MAREVEIPRSPDILQSTHPNRVHGEVAPIPNRPPGEDWVPDPDRVGPDATRDRSEHLEPIDIEGIASVNVPQGEVMEDVPIEDRDFIP
jgi:hypothetical protein